MKKLLIFFSFVFLLRSNYQSQINFTNFPGIEKVLVKSQKSNKPIFIYVYADWLNMCVQMEKSLFRDTAVSNFFNSNFDCYKINSDDDKDYVFRNQFEIETNLYFLILDTTGNVLNSSGGFYSDSEEFLALGKLGYYKFYPEKSPWKLNEKQYDSGNRLPSFLKDYAISMLDGNYSDEKITIVVNDFWTVADTSFVEDWDKIEILNYFESTLDGRINYFIEKKDYILQEMGEDYFYSKLLSLIDINLEKAISEKDENLYHQIEKFAEKNFKNEEYVIYEDLIMYLEDLWEKGEGN
jgi:thioredoxin-related protein